MISPGKIIIDVPCKKLSTQELRHAKKETPQLFGTLIREIFMPGRKTPVYIELQSDPCIQQIEIQQSAWTPDVNVTCVLTDDGHWIVSAIRNIPAEQPLVEAEHRSDGVVKHDWADLATSKWLDMQQQFSDQLQQEQAMREQLQKEVFEKLQHFSNQFTQEQAVCQQLSDQLRQEQTLHHQQLSQMSDTNSRQQEQLLRLTMRITSLEQKATLGLKEEIQRLCQHVDKLEESYLSRESSSQQTVDKHIATIKDDQARLNSQIQTLQKEVQAAATQRLSKEVIALENLHEVGGRWPLPRLLNCLFACRHRRWSGHVWVMHLLKQQNLLERSRGLQRSLAMQQSHHRLDFLTLYNLIYLLLHHMCL